MATRQFSELFMDTGIEKHWLLLSFWLKRKRIKDRKKEGKQVRRSERAKREY
jgi:hypothetical protein